MSAQNIKGVVLGESEPLPGATVLVKGTNNGTTTDFDGNFSIQANQDDILVISFVGFLTQEVEIGNQSNLTISLLQDLLEEVVVTGYGTQKKEEITSAIVSISSEDFNGGNINDPTQLLQG